MTSGAVLAAARRTTTCRHFGLHFASQVEPPYALCTVVPKKRAARQAGSQPAQSLAAVAAGGGDEVRSGGAARCPQPTDDRRHRWETRDGVASKVDVFEVVRAVSRR